MPKTIVPASNKPNQVIIPKPTRSEIIEALVQLEMSNIQKEQARWVEQYRELNNAFTDEFKLFLSANPKFLIDACFATDPYVSEKNIALGAPNWDLNHLPAVALKTLARALLVHRGKRPGSAGTHELRKKFSEALRCDPTRVKALVESTEVANLLVHIKGEPKQLNQETQ